MRLWRSGGVEEWRSKGVECVPIRWFFEKWDFAYLVVLHITLCMPQD